MAQRISVQEFENNSEYTKQALRELNKQMKDFKFKKSREEDNHRDESDEDILEDTDDCKVRIVKCHTPKKRKVIDYDYVCSLQERLDNTRKRLDKMSVEFDTTEIRLHQKTLELSNAQVDIDAMSQEMQRCKKLADLRYKNLFFYFCWSVVLNISFICYFMF